MNASAGMVRIGRPRVRARAVALLPLSRRAFRLSFDLVALRARCVEEPMGGTRRG